jgi:hypothetical protein
VRRFSRTAALAAALVLALAGCGLSSVSSSGITVPAGPAALDAFGLRERCNPGPGSDACTDRAFGVVGEMLQNLGSPSPPAPGLTAPLVAPFTIQVDRNPAWEWRSADGSGGSTAAAVIDLEPFLSGRGDAIVRIGGDDPGYPVTPELAQRLVDALFVREG